MSQIKKQLTTIVSKEFSEIVNNQDAIISNFWSLEGELEYKKDQLNPLEKSIDLINEAEETILIYTSYLTYDKLQILLEDKAKKGVRIYILTKDLTPHEKLCRFGVMRENKDIDSSFIILNHKNNDKSKGIWFAGDLTKRNNSQNFLLSLNPQQIGDASYWFQILFWSANSEEIFFGQKRRCRSLLDTYSQRDLTNGFITSNDNLEKRIKNQEISELWVDDYNYSKLEIYFTEANKISFLINENVKKSMDFDHFINKEIQGVHNKLPFSYIGSKERTLILRTDILIELDKIQNSQIKKQISYWPWKFNRTEKIQNINTLILLTESDWDNPKPIKIQDQEEILLENIDCNNMEDWLKIYNGDLIKKPKIEQKQIYARNILQKWYVNPPFLPKTAKKHRIYEKWESFKKLYEEKIESLKKIIDTEIKSEDKYDKKTKRKFLAKKGIWIDFLKDLDKLTNITFDSLISIEDVNKNIEKIYTIENEFRNHLSEITEKIGVEENKGDTSEDNELAEISKSIPKKSIKTNENKSTKNISKDLLFKNRPNTLLPKIGILYEDSKRDYLCIKHIQEIVEVSGIVAQYPNAKLVCEKIEM